MRPIDQATVLVTGATDGLGRGVAGELASRGATVLVHGRSAERGERVVDDLKQATGNDRIHLYIADLANLRQVDRLADELIRDHEQLHVVVNNAGIGAGLPYGRERQESVDGIELRFAVDLAERLPADEVTVNSLHPAMPTKIVTEENQPIDALESGVANVVPLVVDPDLADVTGSFFDRDAESKAHPQAYDPADRQRLRELSERLVADARQRR